MSNLRSVRISDTRTPGNTLVLAVRATTFSQLIDELSTEHGKSYSGMKCTFGATGATEFEEADGSSVLPAGDFRVFFTPQKQKSGVN